MGGGGRRIIGTLTVFSVCVRFEQRRAVIVNTQYILERTDPRHDHLWKVRQLIDMLSENFLKG